MQGRATIESARATEPKSTDLLIIGAGAAGLTGATVAATEGLSVTILEKSGLIGGTAAISGGGVWVPVNDHMNEVGVDDSRAEALEYMRACAGDAGDDEILVTLVDRGAEMIRYLENRAGLAMRAWPPKGPTLDYRPWLPGAKHGGRPLDPGKFPVADLEEEATLVRLGPQSAWVVDRLSYYTERLFATPPDEQAANPYASNTGTSELPEFFAAGAALVGQLFRACRAAGVNIIRNAPVTRLLREGDRVTGAEYEHEGDGKRIEAFRGVLMATGGYAQNKELRRLWMQRPLEHSCEIDENQGDGHLMGMEVGAQVANLGDAWWMPQTRVPENRSTNAAMNIAGLREDRILPHTLMVNARGKRFTNEAQNYYDIVEAFGLKTGGTPRNMPAYLIFDSQAVEKYAALASRIVALQGIVTKAATIEELAARLEIDASLSTTIQRFNRFARAGVDEDFARGENQWDRAWGDPDQPNPSLGTIEKAPFYAFELVAGALATKGGLRVNASAQVLSASHSGGPIPGLYAAGNCSNAAVAGGYPGPGATLGPAMTFGYIAARHAAATSPLRHRD